MAKKIAGQHALMKKINRALVLDLIRRKEAITRLDLATQTGLDPKTITNFTRELMTEGIIDGDGFEKSTGGRKRERLVLNADARLFVGIDVGASHLTAVLVNLKGEIVKEEFHSLKDSISSAELEKKINKILSNMMNTDLNEKNIPGVGLVAPGLLNRDQTSWVYSANIRALENLPLKSNLEKRFGLPVFLEDCSRASALSEKWFGKARQRSDFMALDLGVGIGIGIVFNNRLYRGQNGAAGEIGHSTVVRAGELCRCGKKGCLETVASVPALIEYYRKKSAANNKIPITLETIFNEAKNGSKIARRVFTRYGHHLGVAVANIINVFDPGLIVICGGVACTREFFQHSFEEALNKNCIPFREDNIEIQWSDFPKMASAMGAAVLPLKEYYNADLIQ
jgi:predicted NBD/HSP70 family sugar kinase